LKAYVSAGSNLGAVLAKLSAAAVRLEETFGPVRTSPTYRTAPLGPVVDQPHFLNAVFEIEVPADLNADDLLFVLQRIERALGRDREIEVRQGPRAIDLDLLLVGDRVVSSAAVIVPHPRLAERRFALQPLCDLVGPEFVLPGIGKTIGELLDTAAISSQQVEAIC
jgi:2-amino-4-hydroxy-6-hydroxymethyldihydropteridine diphosphokinase